MVKLHSFFGQVYFELNLFPSRLSPSPNLPNTQTEYESNSKCIKSWIAQYPTYEHLLLHLKHHVQIFLPWFNIDVLSFIKKKKNSMKRLRKGSGLIF